MKRVIIQYYLLGKCFVPINKLHLQEEHYALLNLDK